MNAFNGNGASAGYVTHDQNEALTMSDRVAVMRGGHIEQCAEPRELYEAPATAFVPNFLGASNLVPVSVTDANGEGARPYEARIPIRGRDLDATGRVHPAVLLTYLGEARDAWLDARLGDMAATPRLEVAHVSADFGHVPTRSDAEVRVRCALDGLGATSVRTRETIETVAGELVVSAGVTVLVCGEDSGPRPLTDVEREALLS